MTWIGATIQVENPNYCILYDRHKSIDIFYTAFILQPYVHKSSSFPPLFLFNDEIQNAYDYQPSRKKTLCTQFSWVYCAMHNCNRGCIKLRRERMKQKLSIPPKELNRMWVSTTHVRIEFMGHVWFSSCIILEIFFHYHCNDMHWTPPKKVEVFYCIIFHGQKKQFCPKGEKPIT